MTKTAHIMIGIPASGKSTMASKLNGIVVSLDSFREKINGNASDMRDHDRVVFEFNQEMIKILESGEDIVIDNTNVRPRDRKRLCRLLSAKSYRIVGHWLDCPLERALKNRELRVRKVPVNVIQRMRDTLAMNPPKKDEGFDEIIRYDKGE